MSKNPIGRDNFPLIRNNARYLKNARFTYFCEVHGQSEHSTRTGKCVQCYDAQLRPRDQNRMEARAKKHTSYLSHCVVHGEVLHHTKRGVCLDCYDTLGELRATGGYYVDKKGVISALQDILDSVWVTGPDKVMLPDKSLVNRKDAGTASTIRRMQLAHRFGWKYRIASGTVIDEVAYVHPDDPAFIYVLRERGFPKLAKDYWIYEPSYPPGHLFDREGRTYVNKEGGR